MATTRPGGSETKLERVPVYILAGGKSERFGSDKARALDRGVPLLVGVAEALAPVATETVVVARQEGAYTDLGLRTIGDVVLGVGPMGGLLTAIEDRSEEGWLFLSACDWRGLRAEWVQPLLAECRPGARAVAYRTDRFEPLFALYHTSIRAEVAGQIAAGDVAMQALLGGVGAVAVDAPAEWAHAANANRPFSEDAASPNSAKKFGV